MLDDYYHVRGWSKDGVPTKAKLAILDLPEVADQIGV
jgi:aldehyde:ferredoxin oxidoreductase